MIIKTLKLYLLGLVLGSAFVIPGLSGGVLAVALGIYDKIIFNLNTLRSNPRQSIIFLMPLGVGIISSVLLTVKILLYFINNYYVILVMLFSGLIIAGIPIIYKKSLCNKRINIMYLFLGTIISLLPFILKLDFNITNYSFGVYILLFLLGLILSLTIILPGISGSLILINLGLYEPILTSINEIMKLNNVFYNLIFLLPIGIGIILGLYFFTKLIYYLLLKHTYKIYSFIFGIVISSLVILLRSVFSYNFNIIEFIIGFILMWISYLLCTKTFENQL